MSTPVSPAKILFSQRRCNYGYYLYFLLSRSQRALASKTDLLIPLFPQDVHCYRNLFYMTTHISAAQMLPRPPLHTPCLHHTSLLQLPHSTCGCSSSTLFINSFLMLPDGMTVIYCGLRAFVCMRVHVFD